MALCLVLATILVSSPAQARPAPVKVLEYNLCGAACHHGLVAPVAAYTVAKVHRYHPDVVFLVEVCYSQYRQIKAKLVDEGYFAMYASSTRSNWCSSDDDRYGTGFGVALFAKGKLSGRQVRQLTSPPGFEHRQALGGWVTLRGRRTWVATVHTAPSDAAGLPRQLGEVGAWLSSKGPRVLAGGDYNALPTHPGIVALTMRFRELDSRAQPTFDVADRKIDYVFSKGFGRSSVTTYPSIMSDHWLYVGSVTP